MKKHPILTVVIALLVIYLIIDALGALGFMPTIHMQPAPAASTSPAASAAPKEKKSMAPVAAKMFDNSLKQAFGNNYETNLDVENGIFHVDTWFDQFDAAYIETMKTEGKDLDTWNQIVDRVKNVTASMQSTFDEVCEDENITVVTSICDPQHHDISYLTVANGVAGYDVVNGIDLLNK